MLIEEMEEEMSHTNVERVYYGDVFHFADVTYDEALNSGGMLMLVKPLSDVAPYGKVVGVYLDTGAMVLINVGRKVVVHRSKILVGRGEVTND